MSSFCETKRTEIGKKTVGRGSEIEMTSRVIIVVVIVANVSIPRAHVCVYTFTDVRVRALSVYLHSVS